MPRSREELKKQNKALAFAFAASVALNIFTVVTNGKHLKSIREYEGFNSDLIKEHVACQEKLKSLER